MLLATSELCPKKIFLAFTHPFSNKHDILTLTMANGRPPWGYIASEDGGWNLRREPRLPIEFLTHKELEPEESHEFWPVSGVKSLTQALSHVSGFIITHTPKYEPFESLSKGFDGLRVISKSFQLIFSVNSQHDRDRNGRLRPVSIVVRSEV